MAHTVHVGTCIYIFINEDEGGLVKSKISLFQVQRIVYILYDNMQRKVLSGSRSLCSCYERPPSETRRF